MLNPGIKIYEYRLALKMSQAELAQRAGLAQANLSNIEKGKRDFTVSTLLRIASALGIKPALLIEETGQKGLRLTREKIEKLAEVILNAEVKAPSELKDLAELFRQILPGTNARLSMKKINLAWVKLRERLTSSEIKGILDRVQDAQQRIYAQTAD